MGREEWKMEEMESSFSLDEQERSESPSISDADWSSACTVIECDQDSSNPASSSTAPDHHQPQVIISAQLLDASQLEASKTQQEMAQHYQFRGLTTEQHHHFGNSADHLGSSGLHYLSSEQRNLADPSTRVAFASRRVRDYFERLRPSTGGQDSRRLYQFFKSTRTELVASLLFTLVSSQALIVERTQTRGSSHLVGWLASAFTVASLTQVFGHISGCHLAPSVSLALCIKGHISRARLASYLVAQAVGALLGVGLLALLTSSQVTPLEYGRLLRAHSAPTNPTTTNQSDGSLGRRRRDTTTSGGGGLSGWSEGQPSQASETLLMSIMEQRLAELAEKRATAASKTGEEKSISGQALGTREKETTTTTKVAANDPRPADLAAILGGRRLRRRRRQPSGEPRLANPEANYYINLLELALPLPIMAGDSARQCLEQRLSWPAGDLEQAGLAWCLSLSNSSQMFIFQLLASLLVVLTYLVNVDPRRIDTGFKSLSIGLAYLVAGVLTVTSGGFYAAPAQLLALAWFASGARWQPEWIIYLVTPLIAGLFGAISHEYIDLTSLRNRDKQLHLRRSFYSLEQLQREPPAKNTVSQKETSRRASAGSLHSDVTLSASLSQHKRQSRRQSDFDANFLISSLSPANGHLRLQCRT